MDEKKETKDSKEPRGKQFVEEIETLGSELVETIKKLIKDGNVRAVVIRGQEGQKLLEIPLTAGVAVGGALALFAPVLAAIGALAALVTKVKVQVIRTDEPPKDKEKGKGKEKEK